MRRLLPWLMGFLLVTPKAYDVLQICKYKIYLLFGIRLV